MRWLAFIALTAAVVLAAYTKMPHDLPPPPAVAKPVAPPPPAVAKPVAPPPYQRHGAIRLSDSMGGPDLADPTVILLGSRVVYDADFNTIYTGTLQMTPRPPGIELAREAARVLTTAERNALDPLIARALAEPYHRHDPHPDFNERMVVWDGPGVGHRMDGPMFDPEANKLARMLEGLATIKPPHRSHGTRRAKLSGAIRAGAPVHGIYDAVHHVIYDRDAETITGGNVSRHVTDAMRGQLAGAMAAGWDAPAGDGLVLLDGDQVRMLDASGSIAARTIEVLRDGHD